MVTILHNGRRQDLQKPREAHSEFLPFIPLETEVLTTLWEIQIMRQTPHCLQETWERLCLAS